MVKETEPTSAARTDSKWATLIPAIVVPVVVVLFLIAAFLWARFAAKRKRDQKKVKPLKVNLVLAFRFMSCNVLENCSKEWFEVVGKRSSSLTLNGPVDDRSCSRAT